MAESSMFFDSTVDDRRRYSSAAFAKFMRLFYSDGVVMNGDSSLMVRKSEENLLVTVDTGSAVIRGYTYFNEDEPLTLAIPPAHASLARIDRVVLRLDLTLGGRSITASVLQGTPSSSPVPPELTRTENVWELSLAQLRIPASAVAVQTVTDERYQEEVCGIAEGLYTLDATEFQQQAEDILENLAVNSVYANPNLLLDSNFRLWDEGESISVSPNGERYTATLWWVANKSSRLITVSKHSGGGMLIQFSGGVSQTVQIAQPIEDAELLNGKTVTLSWSEDGEIYVKTYVFRASESNSAVIEITRSSGSVVIDWMKLELGSVATQFVPRSIAEETQLAARYFWKSYSGPAPSGFEGKPTYAFFTDNIGYTDVVIPTPVPMYRTPSATYYESDTAGAGTASIYTPPTGYYVSPATVSPFISDRMFGLRLHGHPANTPGFIAFFVSLDARMTPVI